MGVPGLQTWLRRRYPEAFVPLPEGLAFDHVYIDMSSTLHQVIRRARTKHYFHTLLHRRLDEILAMARPQQRVVLALDGPAPLAKLLEQRRRRRREVERSQRLAAAAAETAASAAAGGGGGPPPSGLTGGSSQQSWSSTVDALALQGGFRPPNPELSTLALTTGTRLMLEVHSSLAAYICKKLADPATAHLSFEFSDSTVKGEGELKILSRLLHPDSGPAGADGDGAGSALSAAEQERRRQEETHLVLGGDSDLLLMALVAGQRGVYIMSDAVEGDREWHHRRKRRPQHLRDRDGSSSRQPLPEGLGVAGPAATLAEPAVAAVDSAAVASVDESSEDDVDEDESSGSEADDSSDSDVEKGEDAGSAGVAGALGLPPGLRVRPLPALAAAAAPAAAAAARAGQGDAGAPPPLVAFSRDAAERLWREQHLAGIAGGSSGDGQEEVTALALDLMLLSVMGSGNDYLPAIQGMQLSNKHRPGLWDLYCGMRREPAWQGQTLVVRSCACGTSTAVGTSSAGARDCPTVSLNIPMLFALLSEYYRQRFVWLEGPQGAGAAAAAVPAAGRQERGQQQQVLEPAMALVGAAAAVAGGTAEAGFASAGSSLSSGSLSGSIDLPSSDGPSSMVWGREGLAAAAAAAKGDISTGAAGSEGSYTPLHRRGAKGPAVALRGMDAQPESYIEGLEWVLQMYCSGAVRDYRFAYDLSAPSLPHLLDTLHHRMHGGSNGSSKGGSNGSSSTNVALDEQQLQGLEGQEGAAAAAAAQQPEAEPLAQPAQRRFRSVQPLVPAACAMALLPRGGRMHAATALQHLMDEGSRLDEIYATCDECTQLGVQMGSMGRELEGARAELASVQLHLSDVAAEALAGQPGAAPALAVLEAEAERLDGEVVRLKVLMSALSRSQQEHLVDAHPYKPFPTEELESAVAAVPLDRYPKRERKLAQFGREFVFRRAAAAAAGGPKGSSGGGGGMQQQQQQQQPGGVGLLPQAAAAAAQQQTGDALAPRLPADAAAGLPGQQQGEQPQGQQGALLRRRLPIQPWVLECMSFAAAYPRVADPLFVRRTGGKVERDVLPLRPYMQPPRYQRRADGSTVRPAALLAQCHLMRWGHQHQQQGHGRQQLINSSRRIGGSSSTAHAHAHRSHPPPTAGVAPLQQGQRSQLHTLSLGGSRVAPPRPQLSAVAARSTLLQGCTRLLGSLRMLRVF